MKTWLLSIVHHRAIDAVRRRRPTTELPDVEVPPPAALTLPDVWAEVAAGLDADDGPARPGRPVATSSARPSSSPTSAG